MRDKPRQPRRGHDHKENRCLGRSGLGTHPEEVVPEDSSCYSGSQAGNERAFRQQWLEAAPSVLPGCRVDWESLERIQHQENRAKTWPWQRLHAGLTAVSSNATRCAPD